MQPFQCIACTPISSFTCLSFFNVDTIFPWQVNAASMYYCTDGGRSCSTGYDIQENLHEVVSCKLGIPAATTAEAAAVATVEAAVVAVPAAAVAAIAVYSSSSRSNSSSSNVWPLLFDKDCVKWL
jgi:hypothetical protein